MRHTLISATLALCISTGCALAADLPSRKAPPFLPPPPPSPLWTGFYVGLNAGYTWSGSGLLLVQQGDGTSGSLGSSFGSAAAPAAASVDGFIGGGQVGYNYQINSFVAGIEADIQGLAASNGHFHQSSPLPFAQDNWIARSVDYLGTVRGRIGYLVMPTLLVYGTGGLAYGQANLSISGAQTVALAGTPTNSFSGAYSDTRVGWTAGGGAEWLFLPQWSAKVEYLYYDLGRASASVSPVSNTYVSGNAGVVLGSPVPSSKFKGQIVRAGVNYHFNLFNPSAPVVAKF
jgi:outer membrane immunogenic protein